MNRFDSTTKIEHPRVLINHPPSLRQPIGRYTFSSDFLRIVYPCVPPLDSFLLLLLPLARLLLIFHSHSEFV